MLYTTFFHKCNNTLQDLSAHFNVLNWWSYPFSDLSTQTDQVMVGIRTKLKVLSRGFHIWVLGSDALTSVSL